MNLIKLLPIAIGAIGISASTISTPAHIIQKTNVKTLTQTAQVTFRTWATTAILQTTDQNINAIIGVNQISDWKASDTTKIINKHIDYQNKIIYATIQNSQWNMTAIIANRYIGQAYDVGDWICTTEPTDTNAHLSFMNWNKGWKAFNSQDTNTQIKTFFYYWRTYRGFNSLEDDYLLNVVIKGTINWKSNIVNMKTSDNGKTITFTAHIFQAMSAEYAQIHVKVMWNGEHNFNIKQIIPTDGDWAQIPY